MMAEEHDNADGQLVASVTADSLKVAFGAAIAELITLLGNCPAREIAVKEMMRAEERTRELLIRRILH